MRRNLCWISHFCSKLIRFCRFSFQSAINKRMLKRLRYLSTWSDSHFKCFWFLRFFHRCLKETLILFPQFYVAGSSFSQALQHTVRGHYANEVFIDFWLFGIRWWNGKSSVEIERQAGKMISLKKHFGNESLT